jgi:multimeric flavodoxin WrbA
VEVKNILALAGSPRKKSNTHFLLDKVAEGACEAGAQIKIIYTATKQAGGCISCYKCQGSDEFACAVEDDVQEFLREVPQVQEIIIATPVYWFGPSAQIKRYIDRLFSFMKIDATTGGYKSGLAGKGLSLVLTAGGEPFDGADLVVEMMRRIANLTGMIFRGTIGAYSVQTRKQLEEDAKLLESAVNFGKLIAGEEFPRA